MRLNIRRQVNAANMIRHGVRGLLSRIKGPPSSSQESPTPKPKAKVKTAKPKAPKPLKPKSIKPTVKGQQSTFRSRMKTIVAPQQTTTKRQQRAAGVQAIAAWRAKQRKVSP